MQSQASLYERGLTTEAEGRGEDGRQRETQRYYAAGLKDGGSHEPENAALGAGKGKEVGSPLEPRREHGTALG